MSHGGEESSIQNINSPESSKKLACEKDGNLSFALCKQIAVCSVVSLMHLSVGVIFGYTGIILPSITDPNSGDVFMNTKEVSIYTSMLIIGCLLGTLISSQLSIRYGQRVTLLIVLPLALAGWLISYLSYLYSLLVLSRIFLGVVCAISVACSCTYISEIAHSSIRGRFVAITDLARQIGFFYVFLIGSTSMNWRTVGLVCGLTPLVIPCVALFFVPNSPRWLAAMGRPEEEVLKSLQFFRSIKYDIQAEYKCIQEDLEMVKTNSSPCDQLKNMTEKSIAKRLLLLIYTNLAVAFTGNYVVASYSVVIFQSSNSSISAYMSTVLCGSVRILGSCLYFALADRLGRRPMVIIFLILSGLCSASLGLFFYLKHVSYDTSDIFWLPLSSLLLFTLFTALYTPVVELLRSELLPNSVRGLGINLMYLCFFIGIFVAGLTYPFIADNIGSHWAFWIYSANSIIMAVVLFAFLPETKGKSLEEISKLF